MATIDGVEKHRARLKKMRDKIGTDVLQGLYKIGQEIEIEAERSITNGSVSGKNHVPSAPGEPPNADTRFLDTNIETAIAKRGKNPMVTVTSHAPYSAHLEFGTSKMAARPFMKPAAAKKKRDASVTIARIVKKST